MIASQGRPKVVLLGMMSRMPVAGVVWQNLHYLLGFERLGCDAFYVETHASTPAMLMESESDDSSLLAARFIAKVMRRFGLEDRWAFRALHDDGRCFGMSEGELSRLYGAAALVINLHGGTRPSPELARTDRLVYLETDPVQLQLELAGENRDTIEFLEPHSAFFTFAENWGSSDCGLPCSDRYPFLPTRQPVVLDLWPDRSGEPGELFTTIGNWRQEWRDVTLAGERYTWSKHHEFLKYLDLPRLTGRAFELALSSCSGEERELLADRGWGVRDGLDVSRSISPYQDYVGGSRGEFTVAKDQNVRLRTGWFSDRSATYLASGRPVVTQETGFAAALPTGLGLLPFDSPEGAVEALERVDADYPEHARAARELAREHFAHDAVLGAMLDHLGARPRATGGRGPRDSTPYADLFPAEMLLEPLSRRPTVLAPETVAAAHACAISSCAAASPPGPEGASIVVPVHDGLPFTRLCLASVLAHTESAFELIVVDNASSDETPAYLRRLADRDARVRVLLNERNLGFAAACNQGLASAAGKRLVLLNNDTLVAPGWLERLLAHVEDPQVGLVGPVTNRIGNEAEVEVAYETWGGFLEHAEQRAHDREGEWSPIGTPAMFCLAMRRDAWRRIGALDERFRVGLLEDDDYAARAREAGLELRVAEDVLVHHFGEASFGRLVPSGEYTRVLTENQRRYAAKWGREWQPYERRTGPRYEHARSALRAALVKTVPEGASVLVVSRGDEELLSVDGRHATHFPQSPDGGWAGHYPADSAAAVGELEALREGGAEYLAVPSTCGWWLDYYPGLRAHLNERHEPLACGDGAEDGPALFKLTEAGR